MLNLGRAFMAKRTTTPPPAPEPDGASEVLLELAEALLGEFFFDPENEDLYKSVLSEHRPSGTDGVVLDDDEIELPDGVCSIQIEALRAYTQFRIIMSHPEFSATVEGTWSFENEELRQTKITRTGDPDTVEAAAQAMIEAIDDRDLDDEEFADFLAGVEDDDEVPMIGDDPTEPPELTGLERNRLKPIAKRIARSRDHDVNPEDRGWLEQTPQILPVVTEALIEAAGAAKPDESLVLAYQLLLALELEFVRYRQDRGWDWADDMLTAFQQRLIEVAKADIIPREDWFTMCSALTQARVPVTDEVQTALADAGFKPEDLDVDAPPEEMLRMVRHLMDELANMVSSPFEVVEALKESGALLPSMLRSFMATEIALSSHPVLREAVPLLLLDDESSVRVAAAQALEQIAHPDTLSPDTLRRAITIRNWIPAKDRPPLDAAIRKARMAGVEIGAWPAPARDLELYGSIVDGSGAQSILAASRAAKRGVFAGVLLRHGTGVMDGWVDKDLSRGQIGKLLREAQMAAPNVRVDMEFVDRVVQHAIGASVHQDGVPPSSLLEIAELLGGAEWKDRRIDIQAETERLFAALDPVDRTPDGVSAGFARAGEWMSKEDVFGSWFEDGPQVQKALAKLPRTDRGGMIAVVMAEILPPEREKWAERFLILALWCQAAADAKQRGRARDAVLVAHALVDDGPLDAIPVMGVIALQTVRAMLLGGW
jgi:hypothetical protein